MHWTIQYLERKRSKQKKNSQVYNEVTVSTILYGSESWVTKAKHESAKIAAETKYLRKIIGKTH